MSSYVGTGPRPYGGRGRPRNVDLDDEILEAAILELLDKGFGSVSAHSIAKRAGVGRAAISRRWFNLVDLVSDAILHNAAVEGVEKSRWVLRDLHEMIGNSAKSAARGDMPRVMAAVFVEESRHPELITMYRKSVGWPRRKMIREALESGLRSDLIRRDIDLDVAVDMILGAALERRFSGLYVRDGYASKVLEIVLRGILRPEVASKVSIDFEW